MTTLSIKAIVTAIYVHNGLAIKKLNLTATSSELPQESQSTGSEKSWMDCA